MDLLPPLSHQEWYRKTLTMAKVFSSLKGGSTVVAEHSRGLFIGSMYGAFIYIFGEFR